MSDAIAAPAPEDDNSDHIEKSEEHLAKSDGPNDVPSLLKESYFDTISDEQLILNPDNPAGRTDEDTLFPLTESLRTNGVLQPLIVVPLVGPLLERYRSIIPPSLLRLVLYLVIDGNRRLSAGRRINLSKYAARVFRRMPSREGLIVITVQTAESSKSLTDWQLADAIIKIKQIRKQSGEDVWDKEIAKLLNVSASRLSKVQKFHKCLLPDLLTRCMDAEMGSGLAYIVSRLSCDKQREFVDKAITGKWNEDRCKFEAAKLMPTKPGKAKTPKLDPNTVAYTHGQYTVIIEGPKPTKEAVQAIFKDGTAALAKAPADATPDDLSKLLGK